jgi:hypothetical protein
LKEGGLKLDKKNQMKLNVEGQNWKKKKINQENDKNIEIKIIWTKNGLRKQMH